MQRALGTTKTLCIERVVNTAEQLNGNASTSHAADPGLIPAAMGNFFQGFGKINDGCPTTPTTTTTTLVIPALLTVIKTTTVDSIAIKWSYTAAPSVIEPQTIIEFN